MLRVMASSMVSRRRLHEERTDRAWWAARPPAERIAAIETIRLTGPDSEHVKQAFPRVHRVIRKTGR
jgi:hypothetical protein